jgi:glycosyltransferase involved in cell wall biosynthesis
MSKLGAVLENSPKIPFVSFVLKQPRQVEQHLAQIDALRACGQIFVAPSRAIGNALVRNGIDRDRVTVLRHGTRTFGRRPLAPGLGERPVRFGYVGRINRIKGYHVMMEAFSRLGSDGAELHVIGEAHSKWDKQYMKDVLKKRLSSNIIHHGHFSGTALVEKMAACDVIVVPTICLEVFGLVIPEAFSLGRPVIITRCGGPEELVRDGIDGLIVRRNDPDALADAMRSLIEAPERIRAMSENIVPVPTMDDHIADLENIYKTAIDTRGGGGKP